MNSELDAVPFDDPPVNQSNGTNGNHDFRIGLVRHALDTETTEDSFRRIIADIVEGRWVKPVQAVRDAYAAGGKDAADGPKKKLPAVLFSGTFTRRAADALKVHSGLICVDLDHLGDRLPSIREAIECDPHTLCAFVSPTGTGLKVIFRCSPDKPHIQSFKAAERYVLEHFGLEIDPACKDVSRLCFVSFDPETFIAGHCEVLPEIIEPEEFKPPAESKPVARPIAGLEPWDDYDLRGDLPALLRAHGWTECGKHGWTRPGKTSGLSATWGKVPGRFYVFTSSTEFQANHTYRPWHVYAILNHGGNWSQAVAALRKENFGTAPGDNERRQAAHNKRVAEESQLGSGNQPDNAPKVYDPGYEEGHNSASEAHEKEAKAVSGWPEPISASELCAKPPPTPDELIAGMLYAPGTMLLSGPSKAHKTFTLLDLAIAISSGGLWLGRQCKKTPSLYLNLELQDFAIADRIARICSARGIPIPHDLHVWNLRGLQVTATELQARLTAKIAQCSAKAVIIDPHYKISSVSGFEESSNDDQGKLLSIMECICHNSAAALILSHHFAKGDASVKNAQDRASGAGTFTRWPDAFVTFTPHEEDAGMTIDFFLRNFAPIEHFVAVWEYPRWQLDSSLDPEKLKRSANRGTFQEKHTTADLLTALGTNLMTASEWEKASKMSKTTFHRKRRELIDSERVVFSAGCYKRVVS